MKGGMRVWGKKSFSNHLEMSLRTSADSFGSKAHRGLLLRERHLKVERCATRMGSIRWLTRSAEIGWWRAMLIAHLSVLFTCSSHQH